MSWFKKLFREPESLNGPRENFLDMMEVQEKPWAMFEVTNFDEDKIKVEFNWNKPFIKRLDELGFTAETEEDTVQLFFYTSQMQPNSLSEISGDESVTSADLPNLSENVNRM